MLWVIHRLEVQSLIFWFFEKFFLIFYTYWIGILPITCKKSKSGLSLGEYLRCKTLKVFVPPNERYRLKINSNFWIYKLNLVIKNRLILDLMVLHIMKYFREMSRQKMINKKSKKLKFSSTLNVFSMTSAFP